MSGVDLIQPVDYAIYKSSGEDREAALSHLEQKFKGCLSPEDFRARLVRLWPGGSIYGCDLEAVAKAFNTSDVTLWRWVSGKAAPPGAVWPLLVFWEWALDKRFDREAADR